MLDKIDYSVTDITPQERMGLQDLAQARAREVQAGWEFVRKLVAYVDAFGDQYYVKVAQAVNLTPKTLFNYASMARNPISHYAEKLKLSRACASAVLGLPLEEARTLLLEAAENDYSDDWIRAQARVPADRNKATGSAQTKENSDMDKTYHMEIAPATAPVSAPHTLSGAVAVHRNWTPDDEVPFAEPELYVDEADTPFDVAERIVDRWGVPFAKQVADEILRWGEWT